MSNFKGYLLYFPKIKKYFPHGLIAKETYQSTPLQRTEVKAYRDSNNTLHRVTSPNYKTKVTFNTVALDLSQLEEIQNLLKSAYINTSQRKLKVTYWDDELLKYRTMTAYIPDTTYTIKTITKNNINYSAITITLIEY
ncbi:MAG: hypothetical protein J1F17_06040 [Oscillospiraceae bacterium]|nr:hypothetical protein [Oscillospiraceae bacterium]